GMRATTPPCASGGRPTCAKRDWSSDVCTADLVEITTSSPAIPLNEYRSAKKLVPRMGEVQSVVASAPALTSPAPIGTSVNTPQRSEERRVGREYTWGNAREPEENKK